jgi:hypothetical protein
MWRWKRRDRKGREVRRGEGEGERREDGRGKVSAHYDNESKICNTADVTDKGRTNNREGPLLTRNVGKSSRKGIKKKQLNFIATVREKWTLQDLGAVWCVCACGREWVCGRRGGVRESESEE